MSDKNKTPQEEQISKLRKLSRKRWFYPAVYLVAAAIVMIGSLWIQHSMSNNQQKEKNHAAINKDGNDAIPVNSAKEVFQMPVVHKEAVKIAVPFYDVNADAEEQAAALINYDNSYVTSKGICLVANDNKSFDVAASMSGKVVKAEKDDLLGNVVVVDHGDGVKTVYQSLGTMAVKKGEKVEQGQVIGTAGTDKYMQDMGVHLHFELRKDGVAVNPESFFLKGVASLDDLKANSDIAKEENPENKNNMDNNMNNNNMDNKDNMNKDNMNKDNSKNKMENSNTKENTTSTDESSTSTDQSDQSEMDNGASHS